MEQTYMKEKSIFPLLMSLALPMMLSMLVNSLYNIVDSIFVAKINENAMTALSLVYPIQNLIVSIGVGFGVAINAMIALHLGAGDKEKADESATQGMVLNIIHGILLSIIGIIIINDFLSMFTEDFQVINLGYSYSKIVLSFSIISMVGITFEKIFQSVGKMMVTMICMASGCIINIMLDPIMIFGFGPIPAMGIEGAAWATAIGQVVTLVLYILFYFIRPINVKFNKEYLFPKKDTCIKFYSIGIPATLNMALPSLLVAILNAILASFSQIYVVVIGIYYKLQTFLYLPASGIIQGMRPLISYNYGAREYERVQQIYKTALVAIAAIMTVGTILCLGFPESLVTLFTNNNDTIEAGKLALRIISIGFVVSAVSVTASGALEALGRGTQSFIISLLRYIMIIIPIAFILSNFLGANGVWNAFWISEFLTAIIANRIYKSVK